MTDGSLPRTRPRPHILPIYTGNLTPLGKAFLFGSRPTIIIIELFGRRSINKKHEYRPEYRRLSGHTLQARITSLVNHKTKGYYQQTMISKRNHDTSARAPIIVYLC